MSIKVVKYLLIFAKKQFLITIKQINKIILWQLKEKLLPFGMAQD
jgi:hypothetical protein